MIPTIKEMMEKDEVVCTASDPYNRDILKKTLSNLEVRTSMSYFKPTEIATSIHQDSLMRALSVCVQYEDTVCIAVSSGIEVKNLNNLPGPYSNVFGMCDIDIRTDGMSVTGVNPIPPRMSLLDVDERNVKVLLSLLDGAISAQGSTLFDHDARLVNSVAVVTSRSVLLHETNAVEGKVVETPSGNNAPCYYKIFMPSTVRVTVAECYETIAVKQSGLEELMSRLHIWYNGIP